MASVGKSRKLSSIECLEIVYFLFHLVHKAIENLTFSAKQSHCSLPEGPALEQLVWEVYSETPEILETRHKDSFSDSN